MSRGTHNEWRGHGRNSPTPFITLRGNKLSIPSTYTARKTVVDILTYSLSCVQSFYCEYLVLEIQVAPALVPALSSAATHHVAADDHLLEVVHYHHHIESVVVMILQLLGII